MKRPDSKIKRNAHGRREPEEKNLGFAEGLLRMNFKGAFETLRLSRRRAEALIKIIPETIYYLPDCRNECPDDECACHDPYYSAIDWVKNYIFTIYPDMSETSAALIEAGYHSKRPLSKKDAVYLREVIKIADDFADDQASRKALDWAANLIYKNYSIFGLSCVGDDGTDSST